MEYLLYHLIILGRLEIHIAPFDFNSQHRCQNRRLGLTYCVSIVSLSLLDIEQDDMHKPC